VKTDREQVRVPTRNEEVSVERVPVEGAERPLRPRSARTGYLACIASNMIRGLSLRALQGGHMLPRW
jgi:hypothetical protein